MDQIAGEVKGSCALGDHSPSPQLASQTLGKVAPVLEQCGASCDTLKKVCEN